MSNAPLALDEYLKRHSIEKGEEYSHTRIGDKASKIAGGSYFIKNLEDFVTRYYNHVFVQGKSEYLTEKQLVEDAPLAVDIDMRYEPDIEYRQHTKDHIVDAIDIYAKTISKICEAITQL